MVNTVNHLLDDSKYVLGVSLDISKAFDSAWWPFITHQLRKLNCPRNILQLFQDYLNERTATIQYGQHQVNKIITRGCPQGSVCGPLLWNITFDAFLKETLGQTDSFAYADDVIMLLGGRSRSDLEYKANYLLQLIYTWGNKHKLNFNPLKTRGIVFNKSGKHNLYLRPPHLKMNNNTIKVEKTLKYLGVILDFRLSWDKHVEYISNRTGFILQAFAQVARRDWGLSADAMSIIYDSIYIPIITYACGTWGWATHKIHTKRKLVSSQRRALLLITKAFRTASNQSLQVIAKKLPIDLTIMMKEKLQQAKWGENIMTYSRTILHNNIEWNSPYCDTSPPGIPLNYTFESNNYADVDIYSDGSRINDSVGCSFVVFRQDHEIYNQTYRLDDHCTVFQAELFAIKMSIDWINSNYNNISVHIHTDSLSACNLINNSKLHPLAEEIRHLMRFSNCTFAITWIRAHQGTLGNEKADLLAKSAANDITAPIAYNKYSQRTLRRILWEHALHLWQIEWDRNDHHITHEYIPDLCKFFMIQWYSPTYYTTQLFTNHGKYASYLVRFTDRNSDQCPTCLVTDGSKHYFYDCILFDRERLELKLLLNQQGINWPCQLSDIWTSLEVYNAFTRLAKINQDSLENLFSHIRTRGGLNDHPSPLEVIYRADLLQEISDMSSSKEQGISENSCSVNDDDLCDISQENIRRPPPSYSQATNQHSSLGGSGLTFIDVLPDVIEEGLFSSEYESFGMFD
ncbi:uncharacterized protein LOC111613400 [Centruroides sculpturatus]|uniref:uncharacterized protein LOC111613400 n=1 Tax=Centruroides sculpturatus TaxID=218467 RepID=UPI000C6CAF62|nr:uncharacterized protein LOC111613400 [Centruroides sculpturatus]